MSGDEEVIAFPLDLAEKARAVMICCWLRSVTPTFQAAQAAAYWARSGDEGDKRKYEAILDVLEASTFRKRITPWVAHRENAISWYQRIMGREGYILTRKLQGATHRKIGDELGLSHTAVIKILTAYIEANDLPPCIPLDLMTARPRLADRRARAEPALMMFAWVVGGGAMFWSSAEGVRSYLTNTLNNMAPPLWGMLKEQSLWRVMVYVSLHTMLSHMSHAQNQRSERSAMRRWRLSMQSGKENKSEINFCLVIWSRARALTSSLLVTNPLLIFFTFPLAPFRTEKSEGLRQMMVSKRHQPTPHIEVSGGARRAVTLYHHHQRERPRSKRLKAR